MDYLLFYSHMDYHACLLVDHVKLGIVKITIINLYGRKSVTTNGKSSEGHSAKKFNKINQNKRNQLKKIEKDTYKLERQRVHTVHGFRGQFTTG